MNTERTRLLYIQPSENFGGAERQAAALIPLLPRYGFDVTALVGPGSVIVDWLRAAGVEDIVHSPSFPRDWAESRGFERLGRAADFVSHVDPVASEIDGLLESRGIDVVLASMAFSWAAATAVCRDRRVPILWRAGGTELSLPQRVVLPMWSHRHPPDALVCNSQAVKDMFAPLIPAPAYVVRNGVDTTLFQRDPALGQALRPPGARVVVGFAGRLVPQKRPEDFLQMAAEVAAHHPEVSFLVAGDGSRRPHFEAMAAELGLAHPVHFLGLVRDMRAFFSALDVLVLPSRSEGCPNIVLEAMAMQVAVVASDTHATHEVVRPGIDGLLFPPGNIPALVAAVEAMVVDEAGRRRMALAALGRARADLGAAQSARRLAEVIAEVLPLAPALPSVQAEGGA